MRRTGLIALTPILLAASLLQAQFGNTPTHWEHSKVEHDSQRARTTLTSLDARPLDQTIEALREEYGWLLDYEDPVYAKTSLTEVTDQDFPPGVLRTPGLRKPAGKSFVTTYSEQADMQTDQARSSVLQQVVADYGRSGNPGKFSVIETEPSRFAIVGSDDSSPPVLDTVVSVNVAGKSAYTALSEVLDQVHAKTGHGADLGWVPTNVLIRCIADPKVSEGSARTVLLSILNSCGRAFEWRFLYDANTDGHLLNLVLTMPPPAK